MQEPKLIFAGSMGAGKTTAISAISEIPPISTDVANTDLAASAKEETTVALDYGEISLPEGNRLRLYGTPGQERFSFLWGLLAQDAIGIVVLIDNSSADPLAELDSYLESFAGPLKEGRVVIGVGRTETHPTPSIGDYLCHLEKREQLIPVQPVDVRQRNDVLKLIRTLFRQLETTSSCSESLNESDWDALVRNAREDAHA